MKFTHRLLQFSREMKSKLLLTEKEFTVKTSWGNLKGLTWGHRNNSPVLLCEGKLDGCSSFRPLVSLLPDNFFYVAIDLPGNGQSDHMPKGVLFTVADLVPSIVKVVESFRFENFMYIGWSLGSAVGKLYDIAYPGQISKTVELDPVPAHHTWSPNRDDLKDWYHYYYSYYEDKKYAKSNAGPDTAPRYSYEQVQDLFMKTRGLTKEGSEHALERVLIPAGDGLFRLSFDQRMKGVPVLPFSGDILRKIYTTSKTPTFCVIATQSLEAGLYDKIPFVTNPKLWPNNNYAFKIVKGGHDVHINEPELMADDISRFLLEGISLRCNI